MWDKVWDEVRPRADWPRLTKELAEVANVIGLMPALRLCGEWSRRNGKRGRRDLYVPKRIPPGHPIVECLGGDQKAVQVARQLAGAFGGGPLDLGAQAHLVQDHHMRALRHELAEVPADEVAEMMCLSTRRVREMRATIRQEEERRMQAKPLSAKRIEAIKDPGRYSDGNSLYLQVRSNVSGLTKAFVLRMVLNGRRRDFTLGRWPDMSLARAREKAQEWRGMVREGIDPNEVRRAQAYTFEAATREFHTLRSKTWAPGYASRWFSAMERLVFPVFGARELGDVDASMVLAVVSPIWVEKHETAKKMQAAIGAVFAHARGAGRFTGVSPTDGILHALPKVVRQPVRREAMPWRDVPGFFARLDLRHATAARAMSFLILTCGRSIEVRGMRWDEVEGDVWNVPAARMKKRQPHRVPLVPAALQVLGKMKHDGVPAHPVWVFPGRSTRSGHLSDGAFDALLERLEVEGATPHGFRTSFRDWAGERREDREVAELCLAHRIGNQVEQAYARSDLLEARRAMLERWAQHVTGEGGEVIMLGRGPGRA